MRWLSSEVSPTWAVISSPTPSEHGRGQTLTPISDAIGLVQQAIRLSRSAPVMVQTIAISRCCSDPKTPSLSPPNTAENYSNRPCSVRWNGRGFPRYSPRQRPCDGRAKRPTCLHSRFHPPPRAAPAGRKPFTQMQIYPIRLLRGRHEPRLKVYQAHQ
jgi:hypothetical protein